MDGASPVDRDGLDPAVEHEGRDGAPAQRHRLRDLRAHRCQRLCAGSQRSRDRCWRCLAGLNRFKHVALADAAVWAGSLQPREVHGVDLSQPSRQRRGEQSSGCGCRGLGGRSSRGRGRGLRHLGKGRRRRFRNWLGPDFGRGLRASGDADPGQHAADRQLVAFLRQHDLQCPVGGGLHFHRRLIGFDLDQRLAEANRVAGLLQPARNHGRFHRRAQLWDHEIHGRAPQSSDLTVAAIVSGEGIIASSSAGL